jgi:hypothetical protein
VSFKVLLHPLLVGAVRGGGSVVCCQWTFFFFSLSSLKNYILIVYVVDISISILILLISISTSRACQRGLTWFLLELTAAPK